MSTEFRSKYEVLRTLRQCVLNGLANFGQEGWDCMEYGQATFQSGDKIITLHLLRTDDIGFQAHEFVKEDGVTKRIDDKIEEQHWQVQVVMKRIVGNVTGDTVTSEDIGSMLTSWFNGPGAYWLKSQGFGILKVDSDSVFVYNDDSNVYQKRTVFTVRIHVPKRFKSGIDEISGWKSGIYPV